MYNITCKEFSASGYGTFSIDGLSVIFTRLDVKKVIFTSKSDVAGASFAPCSFTRANDDGLYKIDICKEHEGNNSCKSEHIKSSFYIKLSNGYIEVGNYNTSKEKFVNDRYYKRIKADSCVSSSENSNKSDDFDITKYRVTGNTSLVIVSSVGESEWGILDLEDGTVDVCTTDEVLSYKQLGLNIAGVLGKVIFKLSHKQFDSYPIFIKCLGLLRRRKQGLRDATLSLDASKGIVYGTLAGASATVTVTMLTDGIQVAYLCKNFNEAGEEVCLGNHKNYKFDNLSASDESTGIDDNSVCTTKYIKTLLDMYFPI
jgi:hypothetical protein